MKKRLVFLLALVMCASLAACGGDSVPQEPEVVPIEGPVEEPPVEPIEQVSVLARIDIEASYLSDKTYITGTDMRINDLGQIVELSGKDDTTTFAYDEQGNLVEVKVTDNDDGSVGYGKWNFEDGSPVSAEYDPNDGFHYSKQYVYELEKNENSQVSAMTSRITYTDPEDGSVSKDEDRYEYEYDEGGRVSELRYFSNGELDHTTYMTYDDDGNLLTRSYVGDGMGEYLRVSFSYQSVDETTDAVCVVTGFTEAFNWERLLAYLL